MECGIRRDEGSRMLCVLVLRLGFTEWHGGVQEGPSKAFSF